MRARGMLCRPETGRQTEFHATTAQRSLLDRRQTALWTRPEQPRISATPLDQSAKPADYSQHWGACPHGGCVKTAIRSQRVRSDTMTFVPDSLGPLALFCSLGSWFYR